jgi:hypothetical protein
LQGAYGQVVLAPLLNLIHTTQSVKFLSIITIGENTAKSVHETGITQFQRAIASGTGLCAIAPYFALSLAGVSLRSSCCGFALIRGLALVG